MDPQGNATTSITVPADASSDSPATSITDWNTYSEYGQATTGGATGPGTTAGTLGYGWMADEQRAATPATAGLTLMGARLYNEKRGRFVSKDPVYKGNENSYSYPNDPVNNKDASGLYGYNWTFFIGATWSRPSTIARYTMDNFRWTFPIWSSCTKIVQGRTCWLSGNPVRVEKRWNTSWMFLSLPGHKEGPWKRIVFSIEKRGWRAYLRVRAWGPDNTKCNRNYFCRSANYQFAKSVWSIYASSIGAGWIFW